MDTGNRTQIDGRGRADTPPYRARCSAQLHQRFDIWVDHLFPVVEIGLVGRFYAQRRSRIVHRRVLGRPATASSTEPRSPTSRAKVCTGTLGSFQSFGALQALAYSTSRTPHVRNASSSLSTSGINRIKSAFDRKARTVKVEEWHHLAHGFGVLNLYHTDAQRDAFTRRGNAMRLHAVDAELFDREAARRHGAP